MTGIKKYFVAEDINAMLPLVKSITHDIMELWKVLMTKREGLTMAEKRENPNQDEINEIKQDINVDIERINGYIKEIEKLGGFVEEFKRGIINFPAIYNGRQAFLCVRPTEDEEVLYFHELDETYEDKAPINPELLPKVKNLS